MFNALLILFAVACFARCIWIAAGFLAREVQKHNAQFAAHEAEIKKHSAELDARIKGGCRQRIDLPHDLEG